MQPRHVFAFGAGPDIFGLDFIERHWRGVDEARTGRTPIQHGTRHDGAGVKANVAAGKQVASTHGDEIGSAGAGADEMNGHGLVQRSCVTGMAGRQPVMLPTSAARDTAMRVSSPPCSA